MVTLNAKKWERQRGVHYKPMLLIRFPTVVAIGKVLGNLASMADH